MIRFKMLKLWVLVPLSVTAVFIFSCSPSTDNSGNGNSSSSIAEPGETGIFEDERDGKNYRYVTIGSQVWMAENLNYSNNETIGYCYNMPYPSKQDNENCTTYGRLYMWGEAKNNSPSSSENPSGVQGICPDGWHLPSTAEWKMLIRALGDEYSAIGGEYVATIKLKATNGWSNDGNGTDYYGFSALPGGYRDPENGRFYDVGDYGVWWTSAESGSSYGYRVAMSYDNKIYITYAFSMVGYSVRCVQN